MLVTVTRTNKQSGSNGPGIFGILAIDTNVFKCVTMERQGVEIPVGTYPMRWMWSEHFQQIMPMLLVQGRTGIELHWGNFPYQLEGCIAVGTKEDIENDAVTESKVVWIALVKLLLNELNIVLKVVEDFA